MQDQPGGYFGVDPIPDPGDIENVKRRTFFGTPFVVGDPQDAIDWVERSKQMGFTHIVMGMQSAISPEMAEKSMRLFAKHVLPRYKQATIAAR